jgi:hypothetical protein
MIRLARRDFGICRIKRSSIPRASGSNAGVDVPENEDGPSTACV